MKLELEMLRHKLLSLEAYANDNRKLSPLSYLTVWPRNPQPLYFLSVWCAVCNFPFPQCSFLVLISIVECTTGVHVV
jgi:hypothetical protein